jgi:hypothetical protein
MRDRRFSSQTGRVEEELLAGGVANAGAVTRVGEHVLRPANSRSGSIHRFLRALRAAGFDGASMPVGIDPDGRERLVFIEGDVAVPPFPAWVQTDDALVSATILMLRFHEASSRVNLTEGPMRDREIVDPIDGLIVCHNDVCWENVVFRDGQAVGLLDWDYAAPGLPVYDLASFARMCIPVDDDLSAARNGFAPADRPARLRLVADSYGLSRDDRGELMLALNEAIAKGGEFVRRKVEEGDSNFTAMWNEIGGMERFDRRRRWWREHTGQFEAALA